MILTFTEHFTGSLRYIAKPGAYSKNFFDSTKGLIERNVIAFREQVESCLHQRLKQTYQLAEEGRVKLDSIIDGVKHIRIEQRSANDRAQEITAITRAMEPLFQSILGDYVRSM